MNAGSWWSSHLSICQQKFTEKRASLNCEMSLIIATGLYSSRARWPVAPNFCSWATRKSYYFHANHMLRALDFTNSEHWAPLNFS